MFVSEQFFLFFIFGLFLSASYYHHNHFVQEYIHVYVTNIVLHVNVFFLLVLSLYTQYIVIYPRWDIFI